MDIKKKIEGITFYIQILISFLTKYIKTKIMDINSQILISSKIKKEMNLY